MPQSGIDAVRRRIGTDAEFEILKPYSKKITSFIESNFGDAPIAEAAKRIGVPPIARPQSHKKVYPQFDVKRQFR